jgi:glycosyltransferase involved in cell wall biosynthesis
MKFLKKLIESTPKFCEKAFLMSSRVEEAFGFTSVEAMISGTPVIGLKKGATSEVVKDGITGYVVNTLDEMVIAAKRIEDKMRENDDVDSSFLTR